jgi:pimeloyl-ACP methyl ester carboxylesterase
LTLTKIGDRNHLLTASVNLDTHIQDVANVLEAERIEDAVLVGHNYGGMVITGVADLAPERVDAAKSRSAPAASAFSERVESRSNVSRRCRARPAPK